MLYQEFQQFCRQFLFVDNFIIDGTDKSELKPRFLILKTGPEFPACLTAQGLVKAIH